MIINLLNSMTIGKNALKRSYKLLLILMGAPLALLLLFMQLFSGGVDPALGIVDRDDTEVSRMLAEEMEKHATVSHLGPGEIAREMSTLRISYAVEIPAGFTDEFMAKENPKAYGYRITEGAETIPLQMQTEGFFNTMNLVGQAAEDNEALFREGMELYQEGFYSIEAEPLKEEGAQLGLQMMGNGLNFAVLFMLFLGSLSTYQILQDREKKVLHRILMAPITLRRYMLEYVLSFLIMALVQGTVLFVFMRYALGLELGPNPSATLIMLLLFAPVAVAFSVALAGVSRTSRQASTLFTLIVIPMAMLSGIFWPRSMMPELLQQISYILPTTWVMEGLDKVTRGAALSEVTLEAGIILLFAVVLFLLGTWRKGELSV